MRIFTAPDGTRLQGTKESIPGVAQVDPDDPIGEDGEPNYVGETEVDWDGQETVIDKGEVVWVDENGDEWRQSQLVLTELPE